MSAAPAAIDHTSKIDHASKHAPRSFGRDPARRPAFGTARSPESWRKTPDPTGDWILRWLGRGQHSGSILATAQRLMQAQHVVRQVVPGAMGAACQVALIDGHSVTLRVPSAAHAAKLRQLGPTICRELNRQGWAISDVHVKITMRAPPSGKSATRHGVPLGPKGLQAFADLAATLPPGPLADAVARLLEHHTAA